LSSAAASRSRAAARRCGPSASSPGVEAAPGNCGLPPEAADPPAAPFVRGDGRGAGLLLEGEHPRGGFEQRGTGRRQLHPAGGAAEQRCAEVLLERADRAAEVGLGQVEPFSRAAEVQLLGDGGERPQLMQLHATPFLQFR